MQRIFSRGSLTLTLVGLFVFSAGFALTPTQAQVRAQPALVAQDSNLGIQKTVDADTAMPGDELTYMLEVTNESTAQTIPLDVMLVLDESGSMDNDGDGCTLPSYDNETDCTNNGGVWGEQPITDAKESAKAFVAQLNSANDHAGVVSFDSNATLRQGLTSNFADVNTGIDAITDGGSTYIGLGIDETHTEFTANGRLYPTKHVMIVLSDGVSSGDPESASEAAQLDGIRVITIGLGDGVDEDQMKAIASSESDYYFAPSSAELNSIYSSILDTLCDIKTLVLTDNITNLLDYADLVSTVPAATQNGDVLEWTFEDVGCSESRSATVVAEVIEQKAVHGDIIENNAVVTYAGEISEQSNVVETEIIVPQPDPEPEPVPVLKIDKTVDTDTTQPDSMVTYSVTVMNTGDGTAQNVMLMDMLPAGLTFANDNGSNSGNMEMTWDLDELESGADTTVTYDVLVDSNAGDGDYTNTATAESDNADSVSDTATVTVTVPQVLGETAPALDITKHLSVDYANPTQIVKYEVMITNTGDAPAMNVVLTDTLPEGLIYAGTVNQTIAKWELGDLVPGEVLPVSYEVTVLPNATAGMHTNTAEVSADDVTAVSATADLEVRTVEVMGAETELPTTGGGMLVYLASGLAAVGTGLTIRKRMK